MLRDTPDSLPYDDFLVTPEWLEEQLANGAPKLRVVDIRGYVRTIIGETGAQTADYVGAKEEYLISHIPGAVYIDWTKDIVDLADPVPAQVANAGQIETVLGGLGIGDDTLIVAYDSHPAMQLATRLWWVCRYYRNHNVRVLTGGWQRWVNEGRPVSDVVPQYPQSVFTAIPDPKWIAKAEEVLACIGKTDSQIVDARDEGQFSGKITRGVRGGHIPGAISLPREALFDAPAQLKDADGLRQAFRDAGIEPDDTRRMVAYCNGGVAATSVLFALAMLGRQNIANYDGSWNEWNLRTELPVE